MKRNNSVFLILGILFFLNIFAWIVVFELSQPRFLEVIFFDVGQGDAIFIETPQRHQILIDGGPDSKILEKLGKEMPFWDRTIDLIILTHPEKDHLFGLLEVLKRYQVENILWTGVQRETPEAEEWEKLIKEEKAKIFLSKAGQKIIFSRKEAENFMDIIHPFEDLKGREVKDSNNTSIVSRLVFGNNSFLFTGDIEKEVEERLAEQNIFLDSDILKVAHHGSFTSSSENFIERVSPEIAVISAGKKNQYGHPHREVLERLEKFGIKILRTDQMGNIRIFSNDKEYKIESD